ncbi:hypothetical protein [Haloarchaeobius amylolyticus]|uniref:hypothetical protein n=1 Tax=Haloarchaeobius amylolyticus TaxID=1198296 RepID=UPI00226E49D9|nr:hypothetical protein [Haloarchaeobius amylolyticus]
MLCNARGLRLTRRVSIDEQGLTRVRLDLDSRYDVPVDVQLVEAVPEDLGFDHVGVPETPGDWRAFDDGSLVWQGRVPPEETTTAEYAAVVTDPAVVESLDTRPTVASVQRVDAVDEPDDLPVDQTVETVDLQPVDALPSDERVPEPVFSAVHDISEADGDEQPATPEGLYRFEIRFVEGSGSRQYRVVRELLNGTDVLQTEPDLSAIEARDDGSLVRVVVCTRLPHVVVEDALSSIEGVEGVETSVLRERQPTAEDDAASASLRQTFESLRETVEQADYDDLREDLTEAGFEQRAAPEDTSDDDEDLPFDDLSFDELVDADAGDKADADATTTTRDDGMVERLLAELEEGSVSEDERITLRRKLGFDPRTSTEVRLDHLQSRVERFAAYADAMETFLDENGTGKDLLEDLQEDIETLEAEQADLAEELSAEREERATLGESVEANAAELDRIDDLEESMETLRSDFEERSEALTAELRELGDAVDRLTGAIEEVDDRLDDLDARVEENAKVRQALAGLAPSEPTPEQEG